MATIALGRGAFTGMPDQDSAHGPTGDGEEMGSILPVDTGLRHQTEVGLVDQGPGVEGVPGGLTLEMAPSDQTQLIVHRRDQPVARDVGAGPPISQQTGDIGVGHRRLTGHRESGQVSLKIV